MFRLASRYALPVLIVGLLVLLYATHMQDLADRRAQERLDAIAAVTSQVLAPAVMLGDVNTLDSVLQRLAAATGALRVQVKRPDGTSLLAWRRSPTTDDSSGDSSHIAEAMSATVPVPGPDGPIASLQIDYDISPITMNLGRHIGVTYLAITLMLLIGLGVSWLAAADAVRKQQAEAALHKSQGDVFELLDRLPDSVVVHRNGTILYTNSVFAGVVGGSPTELVGRPYSEFVHEDDLALVAAEAASLLRGETQQSALEMRFVVPGDATVIACVISVVLLFESQLAVASIARDVTESKESQAQLAFADRMVSVGTLAAGLAHEVNNPLTFVVGNLDMLAKEIETHAAEFKRIGLDDLNEIVGDAIEGAQRVRRIVGALKTFSTESGDKKAPLDLIDLVDASINMAVAETTGRVRVETDYQEVDSIVGNELALCQVFLNLIVNAAHAVDQGHEGDNIIAVTIRPDAERGSAVEVRDRGVGIPPENIPRLFDPFFTTRPVGEGTGLGLSICHNIIVDHGGSIEVDSEVGAGTVFRVTLPVATRAARHKLQVFAATGRFIDVRIMVVDDEPAVGTLFKRILAPRHQVIAFDSGPAALGHLLSGPDFDLIFCDIMMSELDGIALYEQVVEQRPEFSERFVFISSGAFTGRVKEFLARTERPILRKPFTPSDLKTTVAELCQDVPIS